MIAQTVNVSADAVSIGDITFVPASNTRLRVRLLSPAELAIDFTIAATSVDVRAIVASSCALLFDVFFEKTRNAWEAAGVEGVRHALRSKRALR